MTAVGREAKTPSNSKIIVLPWMDAWAPWALLFVTRFPGLAFRFAAMGLSIGLEALHSLWKMFVISRPPMLCGVHTLFLKLPFRSPMPHPFLPKPQMRPPVFRTIIANTPHEPNTDPLAFTASPHRPKVRPITFFPMPPWARQKGWQRGHANGCGR